MLIHGYFEHHRHGYAYEYTYEKLKVAALWHLVLKRMGKPSIQAIILSFSLKILLFFDALRGMKGKLQWRENDQQ